MKNILLGLLLIPSILFGAQPSIFPNGYISYESSLVGAQSTPVPSASLEISSTTKGLLPPRMSTSQKNSISSPALGLLLYDVTSNNYQYYNGSSWIVFSSGGGGVTSIDGVTSAAQGLTTGTLGNSPAWASSGSTHTLNIPLASGSSVTAGLVSKFDYDNWNSKISSAIRQLDGMTSTSQALTTGTSGTAPAWASSGTTHTLDIPLASAAGVTAGLVSKYDWDNWNSKASSAIAQLDGMTAASQALTTGTSGLSPAWASSGTTHTLNIPLASAAGVSAGLVSKYDWDNWNSKASSAIAQLDGMTATSQALTTGTSGTAPAWASSGTTHTLNIPLASAAGVTAGLVSLGDYTNWNAKLTNPLTTFGDLIVGDHGGTAIRLASGSAQQVLTVSGGAVSWQPSQGGTSTLRVPTQQVFDSGSGTYTPTSGTTYARVIMVGGGGGGGGSRSSGAGGGTGGTGNNTTFGTSLLTAAGGVGGTFNDPPGAGGACTINSPAYGFGITGTTGGNADGNNSSIPSLGGNGGNAPFFSGGGGVGRGTGNDGTANTGGGGSGAGSSGTDARTGGGGGSGCGLQAIIPSPSPASYSVGTGGTGGTAGGGTGSAGGNGGSGKIIVWEY